jgi:putative methyltransferase
MSVTVAMVELPLYPNTLPLTSGYLQAFAQQDADIRNGFLFRTCSHPAATPTEPLLDELLALDAGVYAVSCYLWNMRRVTALLDRLLAERPDAQVILGGPQVMNHAADYLTSQRRNVVVCNGEGEPTFAAYLRQIGDAHPDFCQVPGVTFWSDGELVTTDKLSRVRELDEIPSPFAAGLFDDGEYTFTVVETNRGCPFRCTYCYWGAATNDKVYRWDADRVRQDLTWISEHGVESVFIADANWGALPRDVELTEHIVRCKQRNGYPLMISMQAAKNRPDRVTQITEILVNGGLLTSQPVSLQTLSEETLTKVERTNIKDSTYLTLQDTLHERQISSYTELIWPLPGETLQSFREGIQKLCRSGADAVVNYPLLLLRNTPMYARQHELELETVRVIDDVAEADVVVGTKWVDRADFEQGVWFYYAVLSLYNARSAYYLASHLDREGIFSYVDFFTSASEFFRTRDDPICRFFSESVARLDNYDINNTGKVLHLVLHSHRTDMDVLLADFLRSRDWGGDPRLMGLFELDLLARPYVYREPILVPTHTFHWLRVIDRGRYHVEVEIDAELVETLNAVEKLDLDPAGGARLRLDHIGRRKMPYPRHRDLEHNASYCQAMMNRLRDVQPRWTLMDAAPEA